MHKRLLIGLGVVTLAAALLTPAAQAGKRETRGGTQLAQAHGSTGDTQPAKPKKRAKKKHAKKKAQKGAMKQERESNAPAPH
jgi:Ni/Co efflux regulator RcnB